MNNLITYRIQSESFYGGECEISIPSSTFYYVDDDVFGKSYRIFETQATVELDRHGEISVHIEGRAFVGKEYWSLRLNGDASTNTARRVYFKDELDEAIALCERLNKRQKVKVKKLV